MSDSIARLHQAVIAARSADPRVSRTAKLLRAGRVKVAKKLGEEAVEVVIDAMNGSRDSLVRESADLLYNLVVMWASFGVNPKDVWNEMDRREQMFGIAEKERKNAPSILLAELPVKIIKSASPKPAVRAAAHARRTPKRRSR
jgi:phosphoribosyl-ATP pyrophosphohydrolase